MHAVYGVHYKEEENDSISIKLRENEMPTKLAIITIFHSKTIKQNKKINL